MQELNKEPESKVWIDFQDCDPFGHLNNAKYLNYFMAARTQHLKDAYGFDIYEHTQKTGQGWVVGTTQISYLAPARYNDTVKVRTRLLHVDNYRLVPEAIMTSEDGSRIHAVCWIEFVYVDTVRGRPAKQQGDLRQLLDAIQVDGEPWNSSDFANRVRELQKQRSRQQVAMA
jgi:YbgC/YbaW family acyl-CoA thioester hydrolase